MGAEHIDHHFRSQVKPVLLSKLDEFRLLGYDSISEDELWEFLIRKKWKKVNDERKLHAIIQDIFSIKVSDYLSYRTIETFKTSEFSIDNDEDWRELLK